MELLEAITMLGLTVVLPITMLKMTLKYRKEKLEVERGIGAGAGITAGELKKMLVEAVREANAPLAERIEELEHERDGRLPSDHRDLFVGVDDEETRDEEEAGKTLGRRVHR